MGPLSYLLGMPRMSRISGVLLGLTLLGGASSCLYDSADRCDPNQRFDEPTGICVCTGNTITGDHGCTPCGENQVAMNDSCVCADGYEMAGGVCAIAPKGLGAACDPAGVACADATYSQCRVDKTDGYCTNSCSTTADCSSGYACDTAASPSTCKRPPIGQGMTCASDKDCAGGEALHCETISGHVCLQSACTASSDCFIGYSCCPLKSLVGTNLCVPKGCPFPVLP